MELQNRHLYRLRSRNLACGVYRADCDGFIGLRDKFGFSDYYLDIEYNWDRARGTATVIEPMNLILPDEIRLSETVPGERLMHGRFVQCSVSNVVLATFLAVPNALAAHKTEEEAFDKFCEDWCNNSDVSIPLDDWAAKRMRVFH